MPHTPMRCASSWFRNGISVPTTRLATVSARYKDERQSPQTSVLCTSDSACFTVPPDTPSTTPPPDEHCQPNSHHDPEPAHSHRHHAASRNGKGTSKNGDVTLFCSHCEPGKGFIGLPCGACGSLGTCAACHSCCVCHTVTHDKSIHSNLGNNYLNGSDRTGSATDTSAAESSPLQVHFTLSTGKDDTHVHVEFAALKDTHISRLSSECAASSGGLSLDSVTNAWERLQLEQAFPDEAHDSAVDPSPASSSSVSRDWCSLQPNKQLPSLQFNSLRIPFQARVERGGVESGTGAQASSSPHSETTSSSSNTELWELAAQHDSGRCGKLDLHTSTSHLCPLLLSVTFAANRQISPSDPATHRPGESGSVLLQSSGAWLPGVGVPTVPNSLIEYEGPEVSDNMYHNFRASPPCTEFCVLEPCEFSLQRDHDVKYVLTETLIEMLLRVGTLKCELLERVKEAEDGMARCSNKAQRMTYKRRYKTLKGKIVRLGISMNSTIQSLGATAAELVKFDTCNEHMVESTIRIHRLIDHEHELRELEATDDLRGLKDSMERLRHVVSKSAVGNFLPSDNSLQRRTYEIKYLDPVTDLPRISKLYERWPLGHAKLVSQIGSRVVTSVWPPKAFEGLRSSVQEFTPERMRSNDPAVDVVLKDVRAWCLEVIVWSKETRELIKELSIVASKIHIRESKEPEQLLHAPNSLVTEPESGTAAIGTSHLLSDDSEDVSHSHSTTSDDATAMNVGKLSSTPSVELKDESPVEEGEISTPAASLASEAKKLKLWRALPFALRSAAMQLTDRRYTPPGIHASKRLAGLIDCRIPLSPEQLKAAGFDELGLCSHPLQDVETWELECALNLPIKNRSLYLQALTSTTALPDHLWVDQSYERLEFLGDAVTLLCVRDLILERFPDAHEGLLSLVQARLSSGVCQYRMACLLELDKFIACSVPMMRDSGHLAPAVMIDAFEAVTAAIYKDHGMEVASKWLSGLIQDCFELDDPWQYTSWKSALLRHCKASRCGTVSYRITGTREHVDQVSGLSIRNVVTEVVLCKRSVPSSPLDSTHTDCRVLATVEAATIKAAAHEGSWEAMRVLGATFEPLAPVFYKLHGLPPQRRTFRRNGRISRLIPKNHGNQKNAEDDPEEPWDVGTLYTGPSRYDRSSATVER